MHYRVEALSRHKEGSAVVLSAGKSSFIPSGLILSLSPKIPSKKVGYIEKNVERQ